MSYEIPFKSWSGNFHWLASRKISLVSLTRETIAKQLRNSLSKAETLEHWTLWLMTELTHEISHKNIKKTCFSHKNKLKNFEKHGWYKSLSKANKKNKNLFGLIHIWLSKHTSHLNMYNHTNEIDIHWTLDLRVVYVYQMWNCP